MTFEQFTSTMSNTDALRLARARWDRLEAHPEFAKEVCENAHFFADPIKQIKKNSFYVAKQMLPRDFILKMGQAVEKNISSNLEGLEIRDYRSKDILYKKLTKEDTMGSVRKMAAGLSVKSPLLKTPQILEILDNKTLQGIITGYYESVPQLTFLKTRMAFNNTIGPLDTQLWHADPQSFRNLKVLIYLNDVTDTGGPFEIIQGSHVNKFEGWSKSGSPRAYESTTSTTRHSTELLRDKYEEELFKRISGRAGDVIFAEATAFHRGNVPLTADRRILILNFCMHDECGFEYEKVKVSKSSFDKKQGLARAFLDRLDIVKER